MEGGAEGDSGLEGGAVSQSASARPAGREGWRVKFATRHGAAVVGGVEEKYWR